MLAFNSRDVELKEPSTAIMKTRFETFTYSVKLKHVYIYRENKMKIQTSVRSSCNSVCIVESSINIIYTVVKSNIPELPHEAVKPLHMQRDKRGCIVLIIDRLNKTD